MKATFFFVAFCFLVASHAFDIAPLNLGTSSNPSTVTCTGFATGSTCYQVSITGCENVDTQGVRFGIIQPSGVSTGTVVLHGGGGGTGTFDNGYVNGYKNQGKRVIQIKWPSDWETASPSGTFAPNIKYAACKGATLIEKIYQFAHPEGVDKPFCYHGHSGGSGMGGYLLAWYGMETRFDAVILSAGPVFGNISAGCVQPNAPNVVVCPNGQYGCTQTANTPYSGTPTYGGCTLASGSSGMGKWTGYDCNCASSNSPTAAAAWADMSVVSSGADYTYMNTAVSQWVCDLTAASDNNSGQQGQFYASKMSQISVPEYLLAPVATCSGSESVWTGTFGGTSGLTAMLNWMNDKCITRH
jgi:hypothetical protein